MPKRLWLGLALDRASGIPMQDGAPATSNSYGRMKARMPEQYQKQGIDNRFFRQSSRGFEDA